MKSVAIAVEEKHSSIAYRVLRMTGLVFLWCVLALLTVWAAAALYIDYRLPALRIPVTVLYVAAVFVVLFTAKGHLARVLLILAGFLLVLAWWLSLKPTNDADWQPNVDRTAWVEIDGDRFTIHNLRNCDYKTETDYTNCWSDRTVFLSQLRFADLFFTNWGPRWIGHPIVSFQFGDKDHVAFSIEARYKVGQSYSAILGFFRQYELIFVASDERDVIRLRTNYRKDEEVYLYRTTLSPETARTIFLIYVGYLNKLRDTPVWYNALTRNCTTAVEQQIAADMPNPQSWNYQIILNGTLDRLLYERGRLVTGGLPFPELRQRAHINEAARAADQSPEFSALIRAGRVGF